MIESDPDAAQQDAAPEGDAVAPAIPDEHINGDWRRTLVLPNQDGRLRLTSVRSGRGSRSGNSSQIEPPDDFQRHSA